MRLSRKGIENIKRGLRRSWKDGTHRQRQQQRKLDADTLRKHALHDRKGESYAELRFPDGRVFKLYWSTRGRTDQLDVFLNSKLVSTCAPYKLFKELPGGCA